MKVDDHDYVRNGAKYGMSKMEFAYSNIVSGWRGKKLYPSMMHP